MHKKTKENIKKLELELLSPEVRKSEEKIEKYLSNDFIEFAKNGKKYSKNDIVKLLPKNPEEKILVHDFNILEIAPGIVLVTYVANRRILSSGKKFETLCSSIWKKIEGSWQMIFFQGTDKK